MKKEPVALIAAFAFGAGASAVAQPVLLPPPAALLPAANSSASAGATVTALRKVCLPVLHGDNLEKSARAAGFVVRDGGWVLPVKDQRRIELRGPDVANPHLCTLTILSRPGGADAVRQSLDAWARTQSPPLAPVESDVSSTGPMYQRATSTWEATTPDGVEGLVLSQEKTLQGQPVEGNLDKSVLLVSLAPS